MSVGALDLFAGPGGWDEGLLPLGIRPLGIEWDDAACKTRIAAGHETLQGDVSLFDPANFKWAELLIASPPCQAFSVAGKGDGHKDVPLIHEVIDALVRGDDRRAEFRPHFADARSLLVVEPLRWALALKPAHIALEQVPPVLPLWEKFADLLRWRGYQTWVGILSAEQYGVPQTRQRAILMASRIGQVAPPAPTHQRYIAPRKEGEEPTLFDAGERQRIVAPGEEHLLPWISMARALGWDEGSAEYRLARGEGMLERHGQRPNTPDDRPAPVMTSKARTATWVVRTGQQSRKTRRGDAEPFERDIDAPSPTIMGATDRWTVEERIAYDVRCNGSQPRSEDDPAPTITSSGLAKGRDQWVRDRPAPTIVTTRRSKDGLLVGRQMAEGEGENVGGWGWERPSTTVAGDSRIFQPGGHHEPGKQSQNAVRVSLAEAAVLQGFPPDYPFQGSRTKRFEQVGNAVPPPLARAVIEALTGAIALKAAA